MIDRKESGVDSRSRSTISIGKGPTNGERVTSSCTGETYL